MATRAKREYGWLTALGVSGVLHAAAFAALMWARRTTVEPRSDADVPDVWRGTPIAVDFMTSPGDEAAPSQSPAQRPITPEAPQAAPHASEARALPPLAPQRRTPVPTPHATADPEAELRRKIFGFGMQSSAEPPRAIEGVAGSGAAPVAGSGSSEAAAGVRNLAKAFTRAVPNAASAYDDWQHTPLGKIETGSVTLKVSSAGAITDTTFNREATPRFRELVRRTVLALGAGQFALRAAEVLAGTEQLEIEVTISQHAPGNVDVGGDSDRVTAIGFEAPKPGSPGKGYFTLASGRHFEALVRVTETNTEK